MNKEFIPYEQALALKELGFDEKCFSCFIYEVPKLKWELNFIISNNKRIGIIAAPTFSQAFRWFRKNYELDSEIYMNHEYGVKFYTYLVLKLEKSIVSHKSGHAVKQNTYEKAELDCLKKLIELVKNK
jgi:hypothetical protein